MKHLIIYSHLNPKSFTKAIVDEVEKVAEESGMYSAQKRVNDEGVFGFCGIKSTSPFFGNVAMGTDELRKGYLESIKNSLS